MIHDLDETLKELLQKHGKLNGNEIDIAFDQPTGDWAATLSRPTINLYLYDIRENLELRARSPQIQRNYENRTARQVFPPKRIDLSYLITVWARNPEDEHQLLWRVLGTLSRFTKIEPDVHGKGVIRDQPIALPLKVALPSDAVRNMPDLWGVMENQLKPSINCQITAVLDLEEGFEAPMVLTTRIAVGQADDRVREIAEPSVEIYHIGGRVLDGKDTLARAEVYNLTNGDQVRTDDEGRFVFAYLQPGAYEFEVQFDGRKSKKIKLEVPSPNYDLAL